MMEWLNRFAPAIQALSSVAGLLVAGVLVWLTTKYVRLTRDIATSSLDQVKHIREAGRVIQQQDARALGSLALRIRVALGGVNSEAPNHGELRAFTGLTEQDTADLQALARQVNDRAINSASEAVGRLRVILGVLQAVKDVNLGTGWIPTAQEITKWKRAMESAHRALQEIETTCRQLADT
jgi:hypothetical protein